MMQVYELTEEVAGIIESADISGRVHSVYHRVINMMFGNKLISMHPDTIGWTPMSMVLKISEEEFEALRIWKDEEVRIQSSEIHIGTQCFGIEGAKILRSSILSEHDGLEPDRMKILQKKVMEYLNSTKAKCSFWQNKDYIGSYLRELYFDFLNAIEKKQQDKIIRKAENFIGVGNGLTPSGDDFLVGLLFILFCNGETSGILREQLGNVIKHNIGKTTDLSGAFLQYACQGKFSRYLLELENLLIHKEDITIGIEKIGGVGHSSGTDTLTGMVTGCILCSK